MSNATEENRQTESDTPAVHPAEAAIEVSPSISVTRWEGMVVMNAYDPDGPMEPAEALALAAALTEAATEPGAPEVRPDEGHATYISRRPSWAEKVDIDGYAIDYTWCAPTVPESIEADGETCPVRVEITREDMLYVDVNGVVIDQGPERIFLLDTNLDVENARLLAAAIVECCDRIDAAQDGPK